MTEILPHTSRALASVTITQAERESIVITSTLQGHEYFNEKALERLGSFLPNLVVLTHTEASDPLNLQRLDDAHVLYGLGVPADKPKIYGKGLARARAESSAFIDETTTPFFGICLFMQIKAVRAGATIHSAKSSSDIRRENGEYTLKIINKSPALAGLPDEPRVYSNHFAFVATQPEDIGLVHVAATASDSGEITCRVAMVQDGQNVFTQFHAEETEDGLLILKNHLAIAVEHKRHPLSGLAAAA